MIVPGCVDMANFGERASVPPEFTDRTFYMSLNDVPVREVSFVARTRRDPVAVAGEMRDEIRRLSPGIPVTRVATLKEHS